MQTKITTDRCQGSWSCKILAVGRNSVKQLLYPDRNAECHQNWTVVASETSHSSKTFMMIQQLLELSANFIQLPISRNGKNLFKSCVPASWSG